MNKKESLKPEQIIEKLNFICNQKDEKYIISKTDFIKSLSIELQNISKTKIHIAYSNYFLGFIDNLNTNLLLALDFSFKSLKTAKEVDDKLLLSKVHGSIARIFGNLEKYESSLEHSLKSLEYNSDNIPSLLNTAISYNQLNKVEESKKYFRKSIEISLKTNQEKFLAKSLMGISVFNLREKKFQRALKQMKEALEYAKKSNQNYIIPLLLFNASLIYKNLDQNEKFIKTLDKSIETSKKYNDIRAISFCYDEYSRYFEKKNLYEKALNYKKLYIEKEKEMFSDQLNEKIRRLKKMQSFENKKRDKFEKALIEDKNSIQRRLEKLSHAYAEVSGIGKVGIFSNKMKQILKMTEFFHSDRSVPVLIEGETGTGKEIIARMVHFGHDKIISPFVVLNCSAISPTLFESELFGYEKGTFTGAREEGKIGKLELAQGGTLFLDEIGELPLELQPKLLRVLQQKEFYRIGGTKPVKLDVRIICATNRNLQEEINSKNFRSDLYFRLNTGKIFIPALRERKEEIVHLANMFLQKFNSNKNKNFQSIHPETIQLLKDYPWPGNVRELENTIERIVLINDDTEIKPEHLSFLNGIKLKNKRSPQHLILDFPKKQKTLEDFEREIIIKTLERFDGSQNKTADYLGVSRFTIYRKKKKYDINSN